MLRLFALAVVIAILLVVLRKLGRLAFALAAAVMVGLTAALLAILLEAGPAAVIVVGALGGLAGIALSRPKRRAALPGGRRHAPSDPWYHAWQRARGVPGIEKRVLRALEACDLFLEHVAAHPGDPDTADFAERLRVRVPEAIHIHVDARRGATRAEKAAAAEALAKILQEWARGAEERRQHARRTVDATMRTQANYAASRTRGEL